MSLTEFRKKVEQVSPLSFIIYASLIKIVLIYFLNQQIIVFNGYLPKIHSGYGWAQLVEYMHKGEYRMGYQSGLSDIYYVWSSSYRPPCYSILLYLFSCTGISAAIIAVTIQSVITSLIAYFGYLIVYAVSKQKEISLYCLFVLFIFPMNFLKSGTIDDAPLMVLFVLLSTFYLIYFINNKRHYKYFLLSSFFWGLAILTRSVILPITVCLFAFLLFSKKISLREFIPYMLTLFLTISPWLLRNYSIYDKLIYTTGSSRYGLIFQSQEFIDRFPEISIDDIERKYLRQLQLSHPYLSTIKNEIELDQAFARLSFEEMRKYPQKFLHSLLVRLKIFIPLQYYPDREENGIKNFIYVIPYQFALLGFIFAVVKPKNRSFAWKIFLIYILFYSSVGLVYALESRHLYPLIIFMYIFFFIVLSQNKATDSFLKSSSASLKSI